MDSLFTPCREGMPKVQAQRPPPNALLTGREFLRLLCFVTILTDDLNKTDDIVIQLL